MLSTTRFPHPNVYPGFICLDMLRNREYGWICFCMGFPRIVLGMCCLILCCLVLPGTRHSEPFTGWSSAYSLTTVLMNLASFLFDVDHIPQGVASALFLDCLGAHPNSPSPLVLLRLRRRCEESLHHSETYCRSILGLHGISLPVRAPPPPPFPNLA
jgi:hypothetical protein